MFVILIIIVIGLFYFYASSTFGYWKKRKVAGPTPIPLFGNIQDIVLFKEFPGGCHQKIYWQYPDQRFVGIYQLRLPSLLLRDPKLIKHVLVKDFDHFVDRGFHTDEEREPLTAHLVNLEGLRWRQLRAKLTPAFSSGKIRNMFPLLTECSENLSSFVKEQLEWRKGELEVREVTARFTTDVIGSVAFGLQFDAMTGDSVFREMGKKVMQPSLKNALGRATRAFLPWLFDLLKMRTFPDEIHSFFTQVVKDTMEHRESTQTQRSDFLQLMIQLKNEDARNGQQNDELGSAAIYYETFSNDQVCPPPRQLLGTVPYKKNFFTDNLIAAQAFIFFLAGFETSSTTLSFCLYQLALNPECQEEALKEIKAIRTKYEQLTYDAVSEMNYLEMILLGFLKVKEEERNALSVNLGDTRAFEANQDCVSPRYTWHAGTVNETMRMYPPVGGLSRVCTKTYRLPETDVTIEPGVAVVIPVYSLHHDPNYFPNPEKFIPNRFLDKEILKSHTYMPFGEGPRICIGMRFAMLEMKLALAKILTEYHLSPCSRTAIPLRMDPKTFIMAPVGGIWLRMTSRS